MTGGFFNPRPYAGFLASVFPVALGIWWFKPFTINSWQMPELQFGTFRIRPYTVTTDKVLHEYLPLLAIIAIIAILPAAKSRAAWLATLGSAVFICLHHTPLQQYLQPFLKKTWLWLLTGILSIAILGGIYAFKKDSADGRLLIWKVSSQMIARQPWTDLGFDRFKAGYMNQQAAWFRAHPDHQAAALADNVYYAFNEALQFTTEQGLPAALLALALVIVLFRTKTEKEEHRYPMIIAKAGLLSVLIFGMFAYPGQIVLIKIHAVIYLCMIICLGGKYKWRFSLPQRNVSRRAMQIAVSLLLLVMSYFSLINANKINNAGAQWQKAMMVYQAGAYEASIMEYEKAFNVLGKDGDFMTNYGKALSMAGKHTEAIHILRKAQNYVNTTVLQTALGDSYMALGEYSNAEKAYQLAWDMTPDRFYQPYLLARLYQSSGNNRITYTIYH
jgi:O-antigen polymerase